MREYKISSTRHVGDFPLFQSYVNEADQQVMFQILQASIREDLLSVGHSSNKKADAGDKRANSIMFPLWKSRQLLILSGYQTASLNRIRTVSSIYVQYPYDNEKHQITKAKDLIAVLEEEFTQDCQNRNSWRIFREEIDNAILNSAMCLKYRNDWNANIAQRIKKSDANNFWRWVLEYADIKNIPLFFEQWGAVGHLYHPCSKTKRGFLPNEVLEYSPEFQGGANICLIAVKQTFLHMESMFQAENNLSCWLKKNFPDWFKAWKNELTKQGFNPSQYSPMPVHPWQADHILPQRFQKALDDNIILRLPNTELKTFSTMSFRTMALEQPLAAFQIKLSVGVQASSAVRTISPASVQTGPKISGVLSQILKKEKTISNGLRFLTEEMGAYFDDPSLIYADKDDRRFLSVIFRENPVSQLKKNEIAVVVASLFVQTPDTQIPLLINIMQCGGVKTLEQMLNYFSRYVDIVLKGHLDLYLKYGIALEAHQQNTLAVFDENHFPVAMIARDFGGVRIFAPALKEKGIILEGYPGAVTVTDNRVEARNKFLYAVMQGHIGEIILTLSKHFNCPESRLWQIVAKLVSERFNSLADELEPNLLRQEQRAILHEEWNLKALIRMRLAETSHHYIYVPLSNPLGKVCPVED